MKHLKNIKTFTCNADEYEYVVPYINEHKRDIEEIVVDWHDYKQNHEPSFDEWGLITWGDEYKELNHKWHMMAHNPEYALNIYFTFLG